VMICDDEPDLLTLFGMAFKSSYKVILVSSGKECISRFIEETNHGNKIDLLLLDFKINDMPGDLISRKIKEYGGTKIILISAYNLDDSLLKDLEDSGCITRFVKKPISLSSLIELAADTINQMETVSQHI
jgi:CheY-like chemotaxis protein